MASEVSRRKKRSDGEATRERIIAAAIELLSEQGLANISTGRLAKKAGIVQSGFYAHFADVEECTLAAAERIGERLRNLVARKMSEEDTIDLGSLSHLVGEMLESFEREWKFMELMIRYRRDPSPLGKAMSRFHNQVREDLVNNLIEVAPELDVRNSERPLLVPAAHMIVMQFVAALEGVAEGWVPDRAALAEDLAAHIQLSANQAYNAVVEQRIHGA